MKVKRFTKLALAGVGLAATAATLTTATYAWYVTNSKVEATGVQGQVAAADGDQLYIAYNNYGANKVDTPSAYGTKVTLTKGTQDSDYAQGKFSAAELSPQTKAKTARLDVADLMDGYDYDNESGTDTAKAEARYNYAAAAYNGTLESSTYYMEDPANAGTYIKAKGVFDYNKVYYSDAGSTVVHDKDTEDEEGANRKILAQTTFNATLVSNRYTSSNATTPAYATGAYNSSTTYFDSTKTIKVGEWVDANGYKTADKSVNFKFWLKAGDATDVNVTLKVDNVTTASPSQVLTATNGTTNMNVGDILIADAVKALRMSVSIFSGSYATYEPVDEDDYEAMVANGELFTDDEGTVAVTGEYDDTGATDYYSRVFVTKIYAVSDIAKDSRGLADYDSETTTAWNDGIKFTDLAKALDANQYYKYLMGTAAENTAAADGTSTDLSTTNNGTAAYASKAAQNTDFGTISLTANTDTLVVYKVWLEGSDAQCWDSCKEQDFSFVFDFNA